MPLPRERSPTHKHLDHRHVVRKQFDTCHEAVSGGPLVGLAFLLSVRALKTCWNCELAGGLCSIKDALLIHLIVRNSELTPCLSQPSSGL